MLPFDPKKPLFGFTARFPHAKRRIHLFMDERFVYFRPKNAPEDWWGVMAKRVRFVRGIPKISSSTEWKEQVIEHGFLRVFFLPDPRDGETRLWQIVWRPEDGYVIPVGHSDELEGAFFFSQTKTSASLTKASTLELQRLFAHEWNNPHSDVRAALSWCDLSYEERQWRSIAWERGGRKELETVARAACVCETEWHHGNTLYLSIGAGRRFEGPRSSFAGVTIIAAVAAIQWRPAPDSRLSRLFARLKERNEGFYDFPIGARDNWRLPWIYTTPKTSRWRKAIVQFKIEPPTSHERLEAALFLRDWLGQNAPDLLADWFPK